MAMVSADGSSQSFGGLTAQIGWFGLRVGGHPALSVHSSNEPGELSQWLCHDDSTINIFVIIIIFIIIIIITDSMAWQHHNCDILHITELWLRQGYLQFETSTADRFLTSVFDGTGCLKLLHKLIQCLSFQFLLKKCIGTLATKIFLNFYRF